MSFRLALLCASCVLALAGCTSNQEVAAKRCSSVAGQAGAYDQCVARELTTLAATQQPPTNTGGGGY
jgi:hypothetical protein